MLDESKFFFKYRNFLYSGDKDHTRILSYNEFFFPSASRFNDPFDSNFPFHYDDFTIDEFIRYWADRIKAEDPQVTGVDAAKRAQALYNKSCTPEGKTEIKIWQQEILRQLRTNKIGIFSMSGICSNILSWAHYSQSHEGFCVGFGKEKLRNFVNSEGSLDLDQVEYREEYPIINVYRTDEHEKITKLFWTKSIEWRYENEYRIIWYNGANKTLRTDGGIIDVVILGCRINLNDKHRIIEILKSRPDTIPVFQAKIKKDCFGLEFEQMVE
jgi:hypothetical protein